MSPPLLDPLSDSSTRHLRRLADRACDELERGLRCGEECRSEEVLGRYPELAGRPRFALDLICLEFAVRQQLGQTPSVEAFCTRFAHWRGMLEHRLAALPTPTPTCASAEQLTVVENYRPAVPVRGFSRLGHYQLLERIGRGGMGDVYRAQQGPPLDRVVALKLLRTGEEFEVRTFEKEIEVARRLRHANVLPIYDAGCLDGEYFYTMPLLSGGSLEKRLEKRRPEPAWTAALVEKVARALHYAHQQGVLHRDLKPANVLLDDRDEPLVADFGLAKLLDRSLAQTQTGQLLGSAPYMSPEQAAGRGHRVTPASDVWALGVILYEMLTGQRPFQGTTHSEVLHRIQRLEPFRPRQLEVDVPRDLETICLKCLEKEPAWRYRGAEELADDLKHWREGVPLPPEGLWLRVRRALSRGGRLTAGVGVVVFCGVLLLLLAMMPAPSSTPAGAPPLTSAALRAEEDGARPGQVIPCFNPRKGFRWRQIVLGPDAAKLVERPGENASLQSLSLSLLEVLPPNPKRRGYRFTIEMRQTAFGEQGFAGLYFGRMRHVTKAGPVHSFAALSFSEPTEPWQAQGIPLPLSLHSCYDQGERSLRPYTHRTRWPTPSLPADPIRAGVGPWRRLSIEATPERVRVLDPEQNSLWMPRSRLQFLFEKGFEKWIPDLKTIQPDLASRGGLGLYLNRSAVEIRLMSFEPRFVD